MSNQTVKKAWWPMICAIFYLSFIVFIYVGRKCNEKKWLALGGIYLVLLIAIIALYEQFQNILWFQIIVAIYWICGLVFTHYSWNSYRKENLT